MKHLDVARLNRLRLEAYAEVAQLEETVARLRLERKYLKQEVRKARTTRNELRRQLNTALKALAKRRSKTVLDHQRQGTVEYEVVLSGSLPSADLGTLFRQDD